MTDNTDTNTSAEAEPAAEPGKRKRGRPPGGPGGPGRTAQELPPDQWAPLARELAEMTSERDGHQARADRVQEAIDHSAYAAHTAGASWAQIAAALGVTRQSVYRRYVTGKKAEES